jgi:hypothetical protein
MQQSLDAMALIAGASFNEKWFGFILQGGVIRSLGNNGDSTSSFRHRTLGVRNLRQMQMAVR